jgi:hypothetical protein
VGVRLGNGPLAQLQAPPPLLLLNSATPPSTPILPPNPLPCSPFSWLNPYTLPPSHSPTHSYSHHPLGLQTHREVRTGLLTMADIYDAPGRHGPAGKEYTNGSNGGTGGSNAGT